MSETETNHIEEPGTPEETLDAEVVEADAEVVEAGAEVLPEEALSREEELEQELAKVREQLMRTAADYDNFRKRTRKDIDEAQRKGLERALLEILPIADNLERAVQAVDGSSDLTAVVEGVQMVLRSFGDSLERLGVERLATTGNAFDPNLHEAIQQIPSADAAPGTVVAELVPGYRLGQRLLRAAMVAVATPAPAAGTSDESSAD